jgi:hypothetical protein
MTHFTPTALALSDTLRHMAVADTLSTHVEAGCMLFEPTPPFESLFVLGPQLGTPGSFGRAFVATEIATGVQYCAKVICKLQDTSGRRRKWRELDSLKSEVDVMMRLSALNHSNIIQFKKLFEVYAHESKHVCIEERSVTITCGSLCVCVSRTIATCTS